MKFCAKCKQLFAETNFYRRSRSRDGLDYYCKTCSASYAVQWQQRHPERRRAANYRYERTIKGQRHRERQKAKQHALPLEQRWLPQRRQRIVHPDKIRAARAVSNAIRAKRLFKQPCEICGNIKVQAHHDNYNKPLEVRWLCLEHHNQHHVKMRHGEIK